jgi:hypothetical protein
MRSLPDQSRQRIAQNDPDGARLARFGHAKSQAREPAGTVSAVG